MTYRSKLGRGQGKGRVYDPVNKWCILRDNEALVSILRQMIELSGMTQLELATKLDIPIANLNRFIHGQNKRISQFSLVKIADYFGIDVSLEFKFKR